MAKLPSVTDLTPTQYSGVTQVVSENTSRVGEGERRLAQSIKNGPSPMGTLRDIANEVSSQQTGAATVATDNELSDILSEFQDRRDYENFDEDFEKRSKELSERHAASIADPRARAEYQDMLNAKIQSAKRKIDNHGDDLWRSNERVKMVELLEKSAEQIGKSDFSDIGEKMAGIEALVNDNLELGVLKNAEEADLAIKEYQRKGYINGFNSMNHAAQKELIGSDSFMQLDAGTQAKLTEKWREDDIDYSAQDFTDQALTSDMSESEAIDQARLIDDVQKRDETVRRVEIAYADKRRVETQDSAVVHDKWLLAMTDENITVSELRRENPDEWSNMADSDKVRLLDMESKAASSRVVRTSPQFYDMMMQLKTQGRYEELGQVFKEQGANNLSISDYKLFSKSIAEGPQSYDSIMTPKQRVASKLATANISDKNTENVILGEADRYIRNYFEVNNRMPSDAEMDDYTNAQLMDFHKKRSLLGYDRLMPDTTIRGFELTDDDETRFNDAIMYLQMKKKPVTQENINHVMEVLKRQ